MKNVPVNFIAHGGDYNPDQWIDTPEIWDEDIRMMKLAHINCVTVGIFSWSLIEPEEGKYNFEWLDTILDKLHENGISVILATPSAARPPWLAQKYPEVLRVNEDGIRNEFGVRHNHCFTSPIYREKVKNINRIIAERYKDHPAIIMWHVSNEISGECHCSLCQDAFREWLKDYYQNDLDELNFKWWNGVWAHKFNDWSQINSPKSRGDSCVPTLKLCWNRFVTDSTISFYENEIAPLRELTPNIPITTNLMKLHDSFNYQKFAKHLDLISWDNYPLWSRGRDVEEAFITAFCHDIFRSLGHGQPFWIMESTPSVFTWIDVNKIPHPSMHQLSALQSISHGSDSILYFQWRKSRGGHEKFHGAVVDHCGHENTRVFKNVTRTGDILLKLKDVIGKSKNSKVAIIFDWENRLAIKNYSGYNMMKRDYPSECLKWYRPFWEDGISVDVISMEDDFSDYDLVIAPYLYMIKDGTKEAITNYVKNGGYFIGTFLTGIVDKDDLCFLGGFPGDELKNVFGVWAEETDSMLDYMSNSVIYKGKEYVSNDVCDIIHAYGSTVLGKYQKDFYKGSPAFTVNEYGKGKAYYVAFGYGRDFTYDFCRELVKELDIQAETNISPVYGVEIRKRGNLIFIMNFESDSKFLTLDKEYYDVLNEKNVSGSLPIDGYGYAVLMA